MKVVVCGAGQVGTTIARHLASEGIHVTVIDLDSQQVNRVGESYDVRGVVGHASHPATLRKAGAQHADMLIAVTRSDEVNMVACQVAYSLFGVKRRIARIRHAGYLAQDSSGLYAAEHLPIDVIISPEIEIAESIAWRLRAPGAFDMVPMAGGLVELLGIHTEIPHCPAVGERIVDLAGNPQFDGMSVVAILRKGGHFVPSPQDRIEVGDDVYVIARADAVKDVMNAFGHHERIAQRLVIAGAGNIGLHLVRKLRQGSPSVDIKLIEHDRERAKLVAGELDDDGVVVLHGDVLDPAIIEEAQVAFAETIVAVTNDDETNIFASVLARQAGCKRAITLVNKRNYEALTPTLGIHAVVSPSAVTISTVLRHVRRGSIVGLHTLREDFGEIVEAQVMEGSALTEHPLEQLGLPSGMKIGAIIRSGQAIIPRGHTRLETGDRIVALVTYARLRHAEALLGSTTKRPG